MSHPNYLQKDGRSGPSSQPSKLPMSGVPYGHLPAFLPGSASLVEQLDRRMMIVLRDGRHLVGVSYIYIYISFETVGIRMFSLNIHDLYLSHYNVLLTYFRK